ncbi:TPA: GPO family capsid scaffolding protein [Vibrio vulnificus]|uniref:GPO family capsid scaffolding protein n=1 Tax=Vibrio vulnificus TaxID=672 RepID=UPI001A1AF349|nr:GPO family capsid scaffolding protein [Vibrio vulnificus]MCA3964688.1 GPO family capsid scaffolding protein [Vibrio vulnificus]HAS6054735.1 capsid protein [Vibrio vulnificus]HDY7638912.1 GPO family capsid scaffolding protein [Vibrio vulnificus]HDY7689403.1 GPO family capsid scaffolding protein [Vibrio vulnificus]
MPKTSDWVVIATEGSTVDGRKITKSWINDMASLYAKDEYTALIWPEHWRSSWGPFEGKNWGVVEELKAEVLDDKLRLFGKITPNQYLLDANQEGQKLFTSIEPNPDYKGEGRCYLMGLAVTDSPASTGTTQLKFSRRHGEETAIESDALEELHLEKCFSRTDRLFSALRTFISGEEPETPSKPQPEEEEPMNQEQFNQVMSAIGTVSTKQGELEEKLNAFSVQQKPEVEGGESEGDGKNQNGMTAEQFSQLTDKLDGIANKQSELETKFNQLSQQGPADQGADESGNASKMEVF